MGEAVKKLRRGPLTLPSPARGEAKDVEIQEEIPSPSTGEGQGGGENGIFSHLPPSMRRASLLLATDPESDAASRAVPSRAGGYSPAQSAKKKL